MFGAIPDQTLGHACDASEILLETDISLIEITCTN